MDGYFVTLCVICMIVILLYYTINIIPHETDPIKLFLMMQEQDYDARAFTLRYDKVQKKYENYFFSDQAKYQRSFDNYPVDKTGKPITTIYDNHGTVRYPIKGNGYRIIGVNTTFPCPDGYEGRTCQPKPICRNPEDDNALLPLTDTQFNILGLFSNDTQLSVSGGTRRKRKTPLYHNRIYVQCKTRGDYDLMACPPNRLLDFNTMKCGLYDVCEDRLNGYKHKYRVSDNDEPLSDTEYYLCSSNKSKRTKCANNTVFSIINNGCIEKNICYDNGNITLPIDANNYIQCGDDRGMRKHCPNGVMKLDDGTLSCKAQKYCKPEILTQNTGSLTYAYGKITCTSDDQMLMISCGNDMSKRSWKYNWGVDFVVNIDWPEKILGDDGECVEPTDSIITNPIIKIKWSSLMRDTWNWDIVKECFVCPKDNYVWDYKNNVLRIEKDDGESRYYDEHSLEYKNTDPSFPCHENVGRLSEKWWNHELIGRPYRFAAITARAGPYEVYYWPSKTPNGYRADYCEYNASGRSMNIHTSVSNKPPFGFKESTENGFLELTSGEPIPKSNPNGFIWQSITSGVFGYFTFLDSHTTKIAHVIDAPNVVDITKDQIFTIQFKLYTADRIDVINNELGCSKNGLYKYSIAGDPQSTTTLIIPSGYIVFQILNSQLVINSIESITLTNNLKLI